MLSFDPVDALRRSMGKDRRAPDGLLHPSGDLIGSLRHSQLTAAGAPTISRDVVGDMPLVIGTLVHKWLEDAFRSVPVMNEVNLSEWMPEGWTGTADAFFWNAERRAFVLVDYKTTKPEAIPYIEREGIKESHLWQASAYWWAAANMGIPLVNGFGVLYLPKNQLRARDGLVTPSFQIGTPLAEHVVIGRMKERWGATKAYFTSISPDYPTDWTYEEPASFITDKLAPVQERVQKRMRAKKDKPGVEDVILVPHWSAEWCPFPSELCNCREAGTTKIGSYVDGTYEPRKGYEDIDPEV